MHNYIECHLKGGAHDHGGQAFECSYSSISTSSEITEVPGTYSEIEESSNNTSSDL